MNALNILTGLYSRLHNYPGVPYWVLTPFRRVVRGVANIVLPRYLSYIHKKQKMSGKGIIISFTSFPARIKNVWQVVESLKKQSVKPEKIILWLSKDQFPNHEDVPNDLWECEDAVFEVRMVDGDIRSHKKYFYAIQEYPDKYIVTCDDDIYYHRDMLKNLISTQRLFPECIIANTSKQLSFDERGEVKAYSEWDNSLKPLSYENRVQIGIGGVLYPPRSLNKLVLKKELFTTLAPLADDLWLNMMARLNHTPVVQSEKIIIPLPIKSAAPSLKTINTGKERKNDVQIDNMRKWLRENGQPDVYRSDYNIELGLGGVN